MGKELQNYAELKNLLDGGLKHIHSGKVRDSYRLADKSGHKLRLAATSDRVSIFDFMMGFEMRRKGEILNAFNIGARRVLRKTMPKKFGDDLVAYGAGIDEYLPPELKGLEALQRRAIVVKELPMVPVECVVRWHLTGTGYKTYISDKGMLCGHELPPGLVEGAKLPEPIFTPTTKAEEGHDENLSHAEVEARYPGLADEALHAFAILQGIAYAAGIILVDTKFELARVHTFVPRRTSYILADEVMTPDSSRFWDREAYKKAMAEGKLPPSMDKQIIRNWGKGVGIDKLNPKDILDRGRARNMFPPPQVISRALRQNLTAFRRLHGTTLRRFQREDMGIV